MSAQTRSEIADLLARHDLAPIHRLGQNFLADANITRRIAAEAGLAPGDRVVEIGAGTGTLTTALISTGARVVSFEVDRRLRPLLEEVTAGSGVELRFEDVTDVDFASSFPDPPWHLVANLPYNVGTPLVMDILRGAPGIVRLVVMMQREVAERLVARPGTASYGLPSVVTGIHSQARLAFTVPPQVFYPAPRVESAVVVMDRVPAPPGAERAVELARAGFAKRRKMLRASLAGVVADPVALMTSAGLEPTRRAETLTPSDFLRLAEVEG
jgi:16S rRNA (adenine1518-N6/adenine1519-N6)-dimethyltransferase